MNERRKEGRKEEHKGRDLVFADTAFYGVRARFGLERGNGLQRAAIKVNQWLFPKRHVLSSVAALRRLLRY